MSLAASRRLTKQQRRAAELAWAKARGRELARAAKRNRCQTVARLANDIRSRNTGYWNANIRRSKSLKPCAKLVTADWRRRVRVRGKRRYARPRRAVEKSGASKPAKAVAAPRESAADSIQSAE